MRHPLAFFMVGIGYLFSAPAQAGDLEPLTWLAGCWSNPLGDAGSGEYWQPLAGETMLGVGRLIRNGKTIEYEFLRLHLDEQSRVIYTAIPSRQNETSFIASQITDGAATFENPGHDFPQKIVYTKTTDSSMSVRIEGSRQGEQRVMEFQFERVTCQN